jgi:hypothetical protein
MRKSKITVAAFQFYGATVALATLILATSWSGAEARTIQECNSIYNRCSANCDRGATTTIQSNCIANCGTHAQACHNTASDRQKATSATRATSGNPTVKPTFNPPRSRAGDTKQLSTTTTTTTTGIKQQPTTTVPPGTGPAFSTQPARRAN